MTISTELDRKKYLIAEAAWKIILKHGMENASVRNISKEAGISLGSLRYYFSTQGDLLNFAENLAYLQIMEKIEAIMNGDLTPKEKILGSLLELMPITDHPSVASQVRMAFIVKRKLDASQGNEKREDAQNLLNTIFSQLSLLNLLRKDLPKNMEIERLHSFMEGLALRNDSNAVIKNKALLLHHLNSICVENFE